MRTVIDASVVAKWYFSEAGQAAAAALLADGNEGRRDLIAPDLIDLELASVLWKRVRSRGAALATADRRLARVARTVLAEVVRIGDR